MRSPSIPTPRYTSSPSSVFIEPHFIVVRCLMSVLATDDKHQKGSIKTCQSPAHSRCSRNIWLAPCLFSLFPFFYKYRIWRIDLRGFLCNKLRDFKWQSYLLLILQCGQSSRGETCDCNWKIRFQTGLITWLANQCWLWIGDRLSALGSGPARLAAWISSPCGSGLQEAGGGSRRFF